MKLFGTEEINTARQPEFDVAKATSVIGMVFSHCFEFSSFDMAANPLTYTLKHVLGGFWAAPLFMFYMGAGMRYSRRNTPKALYIRGLIIMLIGFALNLFKYVIPYIVLYKYKGLEMDLLHIFSYMHSLDVLQFAGLAIIAIGLLKQLKASDKVIIGMSLALSLVGTYFSDFTVENAALGRFLGLFLGVADVAAFPFFNWFIFVAAGYVFGGYWRRCRDKGRFYKIVSPACAVIAAVALYYEIKNQIGVPNASRTYYFFISTPDVLIAFVVIGAMAGLCYAHCCLFPNAGITKVLYNYSRNINKIYCIHIILARAVVYVLMRHIMCVEFTIPMLLIVGLAINIASYLIAQAMEKRGIRQSY